jgi:dipeptidyl aminopeptidase/acylaminoacyl peptidase
MASGFNQWGLAMQDDVIAGLDWMIAEGYADPDKVCIAGGGYGGYVALVAAFKTPEKFRCAVSFAGVTDLAKLEHRRRTMVFGRLATPRIPSGELRAANSPLAQVGKIGIPILLVHGDLDRNVMLEHASEFAEALEKNGKAYRYIEQAGGDHHLSRQSHRTEFFEAMDEFLAAHLSTVN